MTRQRAISHLKDISMWGIVKADEYNALKMAIKALEQEPKTGWIPVSERLPEISEKDVNENMTFSKTVLSCQKYGNGFIFVGIDEYTTNNNGGWLSEVPFDDPNERCKVIAWMPLPEPYKEG